MSEEEKRTKKQKIEDNRRLRAMSQSLSMLTTPFISPDEKLFQYSSENLNDMSDEDSNDFKYLLNNNEWDLLTKIEEHYTQAVRLNISVIKGFDNPCLRNLNDFVDVVNEPAHISTLRMITFFKLTSEFNVGFNLYFSI
jgi:succinate dehydrogenase flavin-adding protein (antitoxin of CptAB toxin-antitoxin module)